MRKSLRETERIDYKAYHLTGVKQVKEQARVSKVVDKLDKVLAMEDNKLVDEEINLRLEVERSFEEFDLDLTESIDDIKEGIAEVKALTRRFVSIHTELRRELGGRYEGDYADYDEEVKKMTEWVVRARTTIAEKRKAEEIL